MIDLFEQGTAVDQLTLTEELKRRNQLDDVGGVVYLAKLGAEVATTANIDFHARIVLGEGAEPQIDRDCQRGHRAGVRGRRGRPDSNRQGRAGAFQPERKPTRRWL